MRYFSSFMSYVFHPLFMPLFFMMVLYMINPIFMDFSERTSSIIVISFLVSTILLPGFAILMMKGLNLIESLSMKDKKERIGPLIITGIFYLWIFINFKRNTSVPDYILFFSLGSSVIVLLSFIFTLFYKLSLHTAGITGLTIALWLVKEKYNFHQYAFNVLKNKYLIDTDIIIMILILCIGLVGTCRIYKKEHDRHQVFIGSCIGVLGMLTAYRFIF